MRVIDFQNDAVRPVTSDKPSKPDHGDDKEILREKNFWVNWHSIVHILLIASYKTFKLAEIIILPGVETVYRQLWQCMLMIACKLKRYHALERYSQQNYVSNIIRTIISRSFYLKWRYKLLTDRAKKKFVESKHLSLNVSFSKSNNCSKYSLGQCRAEWKGKFGVSRGLSGFSNPPVRDGRFISAWSTTAEKESTDGGTHWREREEAWLGETTRASESVEKVRAR